MHQKKKMNSVFAPRAHQPPPHCSTLLHQPPPPPRLRPPHPSPPRRQHILVPAASTPRATSFLPHFPSRLEDEEVSVLSLSEDSECTDRELKDFASLLGGSYVADSLNPLNGELIIPIVDRAHLQFHLTKDAERKFVTSLVSLMSNTQKFINIMKIILKALREVYGTDGSTQQGLELFGTTVSKIFELIQTAYKGDWLLFYMALTNTVVDIDIWPRSSMQMVSRSTQRIRLANPKTVDKASSNRDSYTCMLDLRSSYWSNQFIGEKCCPRHF